MNKPLAVACGGNQFLHIVEQRLAFSRRQVLQPRVLDLNDLVRGVETMLRRLIGEHIALTTTVAAGLWPVRRQLQRSLDARFFSSRDNLAFLIEEFLAREHHAGRLALPLTALNDALRAVMLDGADQFRQFAREMCRDGADVLKLNVSGDAGTPAAESCSARNMPL